MKKERKVWAMTLIAFWSLAPNQTNAQQDQDSVRTLNEIVVTATKFPKNQNETGKVLTVIDEAQLQHSSGKNLSQLLNEQVGIIINGANSNPGKDKSVYLRGASTQYTLILLDGIPVADPSGEGGAFDLRLLSADHVERIEILKGSQSTLYGSDAIAGVINIITKKKGDKRIGAFGALGYGSYNTIKGNAGMSGSTGIVDYNLGYTRLHTNGISEAKDETGDRSFDKDGYDQNSFQLNLGLKPGKLISVNSFMRFADFDGDYDAGAFADDKTAVYTSQLLNYGLTGRYEVKKGSFNLLYGRSNTERNFKSAFGEYPYEGIFNNAEVFANFDISKRFELLSGLSYQNFFMKTENAVTKDPFFSITSPYFSLFIKKIKGLSMEVGGRYNDHSVFGGVFTYSVNPLYLITHRIKLFANYSTGYKAPTLSELYGPFGANENLKPQESRSAEAGFEFFLPDQKLDLRVTAFQRKIEDAIIYGATGYTNLDKQDDYGFEIEPSVQLNAKVWIRAFYAFVNGEVTTKTITGADTSFNNLIRRPQHSIGLNVGYQITENFFASLNLKTFGARKDTFFDQSDFSTRAVSLSAYQLLNLYTEYSLAAGKVRLFIDAKNILNQRYEEVYGYNALRFNLNTGISFNL